MFAQIIDDSQAGKQTRVRALLPLTPLSAIMRGPAPQAPRKLQTGYKGCFRFGAKRVLPRRVNRDDCTSGDDNGLGPLVDEI